MGLFRGDIAKGISRLAEHRLCNVIIGSRVLIALFLEPDLSRPRFFLKLNDKFKTNYSVVSTSIRYIFE